MSSRYKALAVSALGLMVALAFGCGTAEEDLSERLFQLKSERTELLDQLYAEYKDAVGSVEFPDYVEIVGEEARRNWFEHQVRTVGEGERPGWIPGEVRDFLDRTDVRRRARRVVELDLEIQMVERELRTLRSRRS